MSRVITECPNCAAVWTVEEIDEEYCDACGYPNHEDEDDELDDDGSDEDYDRPTQAEMAERQHRIQRDLK